MKQEPKANGKRIARRVINAISDVPLPHEKTIETDRWTEILFRALSNRVAKRWRFVSFRGPKKREFAGVVDVVAIARTRQRAITKFLKWVTSLKSYLSR